MLYDELAGVLDQARLMIHRAVVAVEAIHHGSTVSVSMRAVLEFLRREGDHTVSAIARARSVSRQHVQALVNELLDQGLVKRIDNPHHRRAPLIGLTERGADEIDEMHRRERAALEPLLHDRPNLTHERLAVAAEVLADIGALMTAHQESS